MKISVIYVIACLKAVRGIVTIWSNIFHKKHKG